MGGEGGRELKGEEERGGRHPHDEKENATRDHLLFDKNSLAEKLSFFFFFSCGISSL